MKKQIKILILMVVLILASVLPVNAADATATLKLSSNEVKPGETFTVILNVACEEGINGLEATVSYDEEKLELIESKLVDTTKWVNMSGEKLQFEIIHNSVDTQTSVDMVELTFKVKSTAEEGTEAKITFSDIILDSDAATNSEKTIETKEVEVLVNEAQAGGEEPTGGEEKTLTSIEITKAPAKTSYTEGENFDKTGMTVKAKYSDGSSKEITNYTIERGNKLTKGQASVTISYTEGDVTKTVQQKITVVEKTDKNQDNNDKSTEQPKKDGTIADKDYPKTGAEKYILPIIILVIVSVGTYIGYKKYREI